MISPELQTAIERAFGYAKAEGRGRVEVEHLLLSLLEVPGVVQWLKNDPSEIEALRTKVRASLAGSFRAGVPPEEALAPSAKFSEVMQRAILASQESHRLEVKSTDVAHLILSSNTLVARWAAAS